MLNICQYELCGKSTINPKFCNLQCCNRQAAINSKLKIKESNKIKDEQYLRHPDICIYCSQILPSPHARIKKSQKFCNQSCSASYSNKYRDKSYIEKQKESFRNNLENKCRFEKLRENRIVKVKIKTCLKCNAIFQSNTRKYCSDHCMKSGRSKNLSISLKKAIANKVFDPKLNRGKNKRSYMEISFENWLIANNIDHVLELKIHNEEIQKTYFVDFFFEKLNLCIELDGTHHLKPDRQIVDQIRDEYISRKYGYKIIRISHKEYVNKSRLEEIKELLGI